MLGILLNFGIGNGLDMKFLDIFIGIFEDFLDFCCLFIF